MKPHTLLLGASLVANALLVVSLLEQRSRDSRPGVPSASISPVVTESGSKSVAEAATLAGISARTWGGLQISELPAFIAQLRAAGLPPAAIRAIVRARIDDQFAPRRLALLAQQTEATYWKGGRNFPVDPRVTAAQNELSHEEHILLTQLLGPDSRSPSEEFNQAYARYRYGNISGDKIDQLTSILSDYNDLRSQVYGAADGTITSEDRRKLALLEKEQRSDVEKLLTPQELVDYDLRNSSRASTLRTQLSLFNPTEDEFRSLFQLKQNFDQRLAVSGPPLTPAQRADASRQLDGQIKAALGDARYAEYQATTDAQYVAVGRLVQRLDLPPATTSEVLSVQQEITRRAAAVRSAPDLTPTQRNRQFTALYQEASNRLSAVIGAEGLADYQRTSGQWMESIHPQPPKAPTTKK